MVLIQVAVDVPLARLFTYRAADATPSDVGRRVIVPFGRRKVIGVILEVGGPTAVARERLRDAHAIIRDEPALAADILNLVRFCANYYQHPIGEVCASVLPAMLRRPRDAPARATHFRLTAAGGAVDPDTLPARAQIKRALLARFTVQPVLARDEVAALAPRAPVALKTMIALGWAEAAPSPPAVCAAPPPAIEGPPLTSGQSAAVERVRAAGEGFHAWLLFGVTGSGKTEIYLRLIADALARNRHALVLVPEINLTPQLEDRFRSRFPGAALATLHSRLAEGERLAHWRAAQQGHAQIVLGTRLAAFVPMPALGLIVIDEEHDGSFKQAEGLRYSARDVAVYRARQRRIPVVLGSATPSLESFHNARRGRYAWLELPRRARGEMPRIECIDTRTALRDEGLAASLVAALRDTFAQGEQSLLFINRRGYAPVLLCRSCGWAAPCHRCSARLVFHTARHGLRCHHCGHEEPVPAVCPGCGGQELLPVGAGTQRIEQVLGRLIPGARVLRVDRDATRRKGSWADMRSRIESGEIDILVGTQMLAKGHDFPGLSLVGIVDADQALYSSDVRAAERLFATLTQVAGRAGRGDRPGRVLVQTDFPAHPFYRALVTGDYSAYATQLLEERRAAGFPPFVAQALLRAEAPRADLALGFLRAAAQAGRRLAAAIEIFDPVPATLPRLAGIERAQLLVQAASRGMLQRFLVQWHGDLDRLHERRVRWHLDVDPVEF